MKPDPCSLCGLNRAFVGYTAIEHSRRAIIAKSVYLRNLDKDQEKRVSDVETDEALKELGADMTAAAKRVAAKIGQEMLVNAA